MPNSLSRWRLRFLDGLSTGPEINNRPPVLPPKYPVATSKKRPLEARERQPDLGPDLFTWLEGEAYDGLAKWTLVERLAVISALLTAYDEQFARHGWVHRNLQPEHVCLQQDPVTGQFTARFIALETAALCATAGANHQFSPQYQPFEVLKTHCWYPQSEIYSLGVIMGCILGNVQVQAFWTELSCHGHTQSREQCYMENWKALEGYQQQKDSLEEEWCAICPPDYQRGEADMDTEFQLDDLQLQFQQVDQALVSAEMKQDDMLNTWCMQLFRLPFLLPAQYPGPDHEIPQAAMSEIIGELAQLLETMMHIDVDQRPSLNEIRQKMTSLYEVAVAVLVQPEGSSVGSRR
ncbi:MAG: hypothetical protein A3J38_06730 [Gammaproteobacteria bacterium RIFCSPHIGHO2_12_FULL_45_9]|nr:MAG: hypothetical protein A3J38_06730 [Gammaproteobacteria bacterium RIFCSPHIGHO2_12_FULL_45_9]